MLEEEKMLFSQHLSLMIKGGVSLPEALETIKRGTKSRVFRKALADILQRVLSGETLNMAMAVQPRIFNKLYQNVVRVGEESGSLEENLKYLSQKLQKDNEIAKKVRGAMIYPAIIILLSLTIVFVTTFFVLPKIINLFQALQISLPLTTKILISFVAIFQKYWIFVIMAVLTAIFLLKILSKAKFIKPWTDQALLSLPLLGKVSKNLNLAFFSRTFYVLLKSGIPLLDSLDILSGVMPNDVYAGNIIRIKSTVEGGEKISQGLKNLPQNFPPVFFEMILVGERSGTLEETLLYLAEHHEKEADDSLKNLSSLIEPILLILVGIFVGFIAIAVIIPVYKFTGELRL